MPRQNDTLERWQALRARFETKGASPGACQPPTAADLARFEAETGFRLSRGYRGFAQAFGPGVLAVGSGWIRCLTPYSCDDNFDLKSLLEQKASLAKRFPTTVAAQIGRLVSFASDFSGDQFGWDPEDVIDSDAPEFGIYVWHHGDDEQAVKLTRTFEGFIRLFTNQGAFRTRMRAKVSDPNIEDPTFDYFHKEDGTEIPGVKGQPLLKVFQPARRR